MSEIVPEDYATSLNVVYFPQLGKSSSPYIFFFVFIISSQGFLICLPMREDWMGDQGIQVIEGWSFQVRVVSRPMTLYKPSDLAMVQFSSEFVIYIISLLLP